MNLSKPRRCCECEDTVVCGLLPLGKRQRSPRLLRLQFAVAQSRESGSYPGSTASGNCDWQAIDGQVFFTLPVGPPAPMLSFNSQALTQTRRLPSRPFLQKPTQAPSAERRAIAKRGPAGVYGAETSGCDSPLLARQRGRFQWIQDNIADDIDFCRLGRVIPRDMTTMRRLPRTQKADHRAKMSSLWPNSPQVFWTKR